MLLLATMRHPLLPHDRPLLPLSARAHADDRRSHPGAATAEPSTYPADMPGSTNRSERGLFIAIGAVVLLGVLTFGIGMWAVLQPGSDLFGPGQRLGAGLLGGPVLFGLAIAELIRRSRQGPQEPGRHTRS